MEQQVEKVETGDIIKVKEGIRIVSLVMGGLVRLRPLDEGLDSTYSVNRPTDGRAWTLLARGDWRCLPDVGWRHVR